MTGTWSAATPFPTRVDGRLRRPRAGQGPAIAGAARTDPSAFGPEPDPLARALEPLAAVEPLEAGAAVEGTPYLVVRKLGQGGMGEVFEVEHRELGKRCVLKVLHPNHLGRRDLAARMRDEARSLATLRHPNLVDVFDLGVTRDGRPFFAMELLLGRDLRALVSRLGVLAVPTALELMVQALDGLAAAHDADIVHRDVKLENLFLCDDGTLKLLDFGVAKVMGSDLGRTARGYAVGTPRTMAPEQCAMGEIDPRTDLYAAGRVLSERVAGRGPFDELRGHEHALRFAHCGRTPPPPSGWAPQPIPPAVDAAVLRAIAKRPEDRFQSAREMADVLSILRGERRRRRGTSAPPLAGPLAAGGWQRASVPPQPAGLLPEIDDGPTDVVTPAEVPEPPSEGSTALSARAQARPAFEESRTPGAISREHPIPQGGPPAPGPSGGGMWASAIAIMALAIAAVALAVSLVGIAPRRLSSVPEVREPEGVVLEPRPYAGCKLGASDPFQPRTDDGIPRRSP